MIVQTIVGPFDEQRALKLARFVKSCDPKQEIVVFEGQECDQKFLCHLLEYLQTHFSKLR